MDEYRNIPSGAAEASKFRNDEQRWRAVQSRAGVADGLFVYAVKTTKIYCRPICKARLARRANVSFFDNGYEAKAAGFRACKRCKPEVVGCMPEELAVRKIHAFIDELVGRGCDTQAGAVAAEHASSLSQMARKTGLSKWHFHRVFKQCVGATPAEFFRNRAPAVVVPPAPPNNDTSRGTGFSWPLRLDLTAATYDTSGINFATHDPEFASQSLPSQSLLPHSETPQSWTGLYSLSDSDLLATTSEMSSLGHAALDPHFIPAPSCIPQHDDAPATRAHLSWNDSSYLCMPENLLADNQDTSLESLQQFDSAWISSSCDEFSLAWMALGYGNFLCDSAGMLSNKEPGDACDHIRHGGVE
ncbi:hypothetical protein MY4038_008768 [Beauveria bassiana]